MENRKTLFSSNAAIVLHIAAFILSIYVMIHFKSEPISRLMLEAALLYVLITNFRRIEVVVPICIWFLVKLVEYPTTEYFFGKSLPEVSNYLISRFVFDLLLASVLFYFYKWLNVQRAPQVTAICTILMLGLVQYALVITEIQIYLYDKSLIDGPPFFYRTYTNLKATQNILLLLGIWSLMLDSRAKYAMAANK